MQLAELKALTPQLEALLAQYGASNLAVFGSVARDQARAGSDVDLLVDLPQGTSLLDHSALKLELEDLLQQKVDLIRRRSLKPSLRQRVEAEAVVLGFPIANLQTLEETDYLQDAVVRCLEVIGEATKRLSQDFRDRHPEVPWRAMAGMRDLLIHAYDRVDLEEVWEAYRQFPGLREQISELGRHA